MSTHTPGPWYHAVAEGTAAYIVDTLGFEVAGICVTENSTAHSALPANAQLIAAAPDLLAALEVVVADWTSQFERNGHLAPRWCKQAREAIARATFADKV